jgi:hypothetical protein
VSATSAGGRHFDGICREADGPDEVRKATREQFRRGADFIKVMTTGVRSYGHLIDRDLGPALDLRKELATIRGRADPLSGRRLTA